MAARKFLARLVVTAATVLLAHSVNAETLFGIYAGAGTWHQNSEGHIQSNGTNVDTSQDMGLGDDDGNVIAVAFEHPVPFVPNVRVQQAKVGMRGGIEIDRDVVLAGVSFIPPGTVDSTLNLEMTDAIIITQAHVLTGVDVGAIGLKVAFTVLVPGASTGVDAKQGLCIDVVGEQC